MPPALNDGVHMHILCARLHHMYYAYARRVLRARDAKQDFIIVFVARARLPTCSFSCAHFACSKTAKYGRGFRALSKSVL